MMFFLMLGMYIKNLKIKKKEEIKLRPKGNVMCRLWRARYVRRGRMV